MRNTDHEIIQKIKIENMVRNDTNPRPAPRVNYPDSIETETGHFIRENSNDNLQRSIIEEKKSRTYSKRRTHCCWCSVSCCCLISGLLLGVVGLYFYNMMFSGEGPIEAPSNNCEPPIDRDLLYKAVQENINRKPIDPEMQFLGEFESDYVKTVIYNKFETPYKMPVYTFTWYKKLNPQNLANLYLFPQLIEKWVEAEVEILQPGSEFYIDGVTPKIRSGDIASPRIHYQIFNRPVIGKMDSVAKSIYEIQSTPPPV